MLPMLSPLKLNAKLKCAASQLNKIWLRYTEQPVDGQNRGNGGFTHADSAYLFRLNKDTESFRPTKRESAARPSSLLYSLRLRHVQLFL